MTDYTERYLSAFSTLQLREMEIPGFSVGQTRESGMKRNPLGMVDISAAGFHGAVRVVHIPQTCRPKRNASHLLEHVPTQSLQDLWVDSGSLETS